MSVKCRLIFLKQIVKLVWRYTHPSRVVHQFLSLSAEAIGCHNLQSPRIGKVHHVRVFAGQDRMQTSFL